MVNSLDPISPVMRYVTQMCACSVHGGRMHRIGPETCVLADVGSWTDDMTSCVKARFPNVSVSVFQSNKSLSGFHVTFTLHPVAYSLFSNMLTFVAVAITLGYGWYLAYVHLF